MKLWHGVKFLSFVFCVSRPFHLSPQHFNAREGFLSERGFELKFKPHFLIRLREILKAPSTSALGPVPCLSDHAHFFLRLGGFRGWLCLRNTGLKQVTRILCWRPPLCRTPGGHCSPGSRASSCPLPGQHLWGLGFWEAHFREGRLPWRSPHPLLFGFCNASLCSVRAGLLSSGLYVSFISRSGEASPARQRDVIQTEWQSRPRHSLPLLPPQKHRSHKRQRPKHTAETQKHLPLLPGQLCVPERWLVSVSLSWAS